MNCNKCGAPISNDMMFCGECGARVEAESVMYCPNCGAATKTGDAFCGECGYSFGRPAEKRYAERPVRQPVRRQTSNNTMLMAIMIAAIVIAIAVISLSVFFIVKESGKDEEPVEVIEQPVVVDEPVKVDNVTPLINDFINSYVGQNDMSVAIINNKTKEHYQSQYADSSFTAWGLYLPVYLAYGRYQGFDPTVREGIVSSDAGTSNNKANEAMRDMGGLGSVNNLLAQNFGVRGTTYGRYFGESNANSDNYTTANDAVTFLQVLSDSNEYAKLSYNIGSFGITAPAGASVYAHVGTENRNVRNDLNIFAIVKGQNSDYCVTILSRNKGGRYISQLLANIHAEMERN